MYKVGDKFIIEIGEKYNYAEQAESPEVLYRIKGFNSLVFDENGLDRLTSYNEEFDNNAKAIADAEKDGYEKGLNDGWECAKKIGLTKGNGGIGVDSVKKIFKTTDIGEIMKNFSPQEAIKKLKAWEEKQEVRVGDVISSTSGSVAVVQYIDSWDMWQCFGKSGHFTLDHDNQRCWEKTGKHIDLTEIFKGLEGENV